MTTVPVSTEVFESLNILSVSVGTNCPKGGDSGHGGRTVFEISNDTSTDLRVSINGGIQAQVNSVTIILGGDTECETFIQALEHSLQVLKKQTEANKLINSSKSVD